jgi:Ammonium Transporter Family
LRRSSTPGRGPRQRENRAVGRARSHLPGAGHHLACRRGRRDGIGDRVHVHLEQARPLDAPQRHPRRTCGHITAGADSVTPGGAIIIGLLVVGAVVAFDRLKVDDPVGATSVHLVCGPGCLDVTRRSLVASTQLPARELDRQSLDRFVQRQRRDAGGSASQRTAGSKSRAVRLTDAQWNPSMSWRQRRVSRRTARCTRRSFQWLLRAGLAAAQKRAATSKSWLLVGRGSLRPGKYPIARSRREHPVYPRSARVASGGNEWAHGVGPPQYASSELDQLQGVSVVQLTPEEQA